MKTLLTLSSIVLSAACFAQSGNDLIARSTTSEGNINTPIPNIYAPMEAPARTNVAIDSTEYDYFAAYLAIQTSEVTPEQLEFTKKLVKYVKQNHGILYIVLQNGIPPCIPVPGRPCPKP